MIRRIVLSVLVLLLIAALVTGGAAYWLLSGDGVRRAIEEQASAWLGQPVSIGAASAQFFPRIGIELDQVKVGDPVSLTLGRVAVSTNLRALIGRRIENAVVVVSESRIQMPLPVIPKTAPANPAAVEAGPASPGVRRAGPAERTRQAETAPADGAQLRLVSISEIALRDVRLLSRGREIVVSADSALEGSRLTVRTFKAQSSQTALEAEGIVELAPRVEATLKVTADTLDVDELLALAGAFAPEGGTGRRASAPAPRIAARVSSERAVAGGIEVRQFATDLEVDGGAVALSPLTFQFFGGRYQGSLSARLGATVEASLQSRILDLDVGQLAAFGGAPGAVTGTLTGAGRFSGRGADLTEALGAARGEGTASVTKGTIQRLNLIRTVVLFFGRPAPDQAPASDAFERMDLRFSLADGTFSAEAFALHSTDADIVGSGRLTVEDKALDGQLDLSLSEALSAQSGTDLRRYTREGNRIVLPARLSGTLGQPRLRIDAAAALQRGLRNEVQRRLGGLLDRVGK